MKSARNISSVILLSLSLVALTLSNQVVAQQKSEGAGDKHLGTWKLVSTKYGDATEFTRYRESSSRLKFITNTHFTWLEVDGSTKRVLASAGGRYTLSGNTYTETIDFAGEGMDAYLGKAHNQSRWRQAVSIR